MKTLRQSATARFYLRAGVAAALAMSALAGTLWVDSPWVKLVAAGVAAFAGYLGIGAATPVEPFVGNQLEGAEVPSPPAVPE
jgi:hypothetical protein